MALVLTLNYQPLVIIDEDVSFFQIIIKIKKSKIITYPKSFFWWTSLYICYWNWPTKYNLIEILCTTQKPLWCASAAGWIKRPSERQKQLKSRDRQIFC